MREALMTILKRILVATDFSPTGHASVARAGQLAAQHGSDTLVIHATPDWALFSNRTAARQEHYGEITRNAEAVMDREINWLRSEFGVRARGQVHQGKASRTILRALEAYQPHLLVLGAGGERAVPMAPAALGGTTLKLITQVSVPLLLVRNSDPAAYSTSLAAVYDAGELSRRIVHWGSVLVKGGLCHVIRAFEVSYFERLRLCKVSEAAINACVEDQEKIARRETEALLSAAEGSARVAAHVIRGPPLPDIFAEIARYKPQVLIVGQHEHRPDEVASTLLGCVGVRLAYHAPVDVLIVP